MCINESRACCSPAALPSARKVSAKIVYLPEVWADCRHTRSARKHDLGEMLGFFT